MDISKLNIVKEPFDLPEAYFENFPERLMQNIDQQKKDRRIFVLRPKVYLSTAAAIAILFIVFFSYPFGGAVDNSVVEISNDEIIDVLIEDYYDYTEYNLGEEYLAVYEESEAATEDSIGYLIDYLMAENIDEETIMSIMY